MNNIFQIWHPEEVGAGNDISKAYIERKMRLDAINSSTNCHILQA